MGKSRLVQELSLVVERDPELIRWRQGRSLPYGEGRQLLGARRDGEGRGRHPRDRLRGGRPQQKLAASVTERCAGSDAAWIDAVAPAADRSRRGFRIGRPRRRPLPGLAAVPRRARGRTADGARVRGPALGRRRPARLRRRPCRLGDRRAAARRRERAPGAARAPAGLGRRQAERHSRCRSRRSPSGRRRSSCMRCSSAPFCRPRSRPRSSPVRAATRSTPRSSRASWPSGARRGRPARPGHGPVGGLRHPRREKHHGERQRGRNQSIPYVVPRLGSRRLVRPRLFEGCILPQQGSDVQPPGSFRSNAAGQTVC